VVYRGSPVYTLHTWIVFVILNEMQSVSLPGYFECGSLWLVLGE
jgi:hypothetical protein